MQERIMRRSARWYLAAWVCALFTMVACPIASLANSIYVTTIEDKISDVSLGDRGCSLKEAIFSSKFKNHVAIQSFVPFSQSVTTLVLVPVTTSCVIGSGDDTIILPAGAVLDLNQITVDVDNFVGPTATPMIFSKITIQANGATLRWSGGGRARAFAVGKGGSLTIQGAYIKGFSTKGGNAGDGGAGGGLGAGGAIYVTEGGEATILSSTFDSNSAVGGNGSGDGVFDGGAGGGGGLGGNGGGWTNDSLGFGTGGGGGGSRGNAGPDGGGGGTVALSFNCGAGLLPSLGAAAPCAGGGGNGGRQANVFDLEDQGGDGNYGGGGGGGGSGGGHGGNGGFGGGGGGTFGGEFPLSTQGGNGGFGAGSGSGVQVITGGSGQPGPFGGKAEGSSGGGGGALGGAIFVHGGTVVIQNSTFFNNSVFRGNGGITNGHPADNGADAGAAIFCVDCQLTIQNATISGNLSSAADAGIKVYQTSADKPTSFTLENTIVYANGGENPDGSRVGTERECSVVGFVISGTFSGNLIENNDNCPGVVSQGDPQLGPLQLNHGPTPTMAIPTTSAARNTGSSVGALATDQRGVPRPQEGGFDIGAFELCDFLRNFNCFLVGVEITEPLSVNVSPPDGGTSVPAAGTVSSEPENSVALLQVSPNPGFAFQGWTGNVADPSTAFTTVVMNQAETVTANFVPCGCAADVSNSISVTRGGYALNPGTGRFVQTDTLTNNSTSTINGPISLVIEGLSSNATLFNLTGATDAFFPPVGLPYINTTAASLAPGQSVSVTLQFSNPSKAGIMYVIRVLAGPGVR